MDTAAVPQAGVEASAPAEHQYRPSGARKPALQPLMALNDGTLYTRNLLLRGMSVVYLMAFVGFYYQSPGLFGNNGILPARIQIEGTSTVTSMHQKPSLLHLARYLGLDTAYMMDALALLGIGISFTGFVWQKVCILPTFAALWSLYFSLVQVMQVFGNQSDNLLLEAGFIILLLAPLNYTHRSGPADKIGFVMIRWLLLRFLFESGSIKLFTRCPLWWNFTALRQHFETMPLPTPLSWYSFNHPESVMKVGNIFTNLTELVCSWFFFFPHRTVKRYVFYWQIYLQMWIILTGNYGFLNFMVPVLLLSLLDDDFFLNKTANRDIWFICKLMVFLSVLFEVMSYVLATPLESFMFDDDWLAMLRSTITPAPLMAMCIVLATCLQVMATHPMIARARTIVQKISAGNTLVAFTVVSIFLVLVSMVPHGNLDRSTNITNTQLGSIYKEVERFHIVNEYGQHLRRMRTERLEIIYEHAQDVEGPWHEYGFLYKPSTVNGSMPYAGPYFARFDHKFYDASASTYRNQLWTVSTAFRLLQNNPDVLSLVGSAVVEPAPRYVRALLYKFQYNDLSNGPNYWTRQVRSEYFPAFSLDNPTFLGYLRSMRISPNYKPKDVSNVLFKWYLDLVRKLAQQFGGTVLVVAVVAAGVAIICTKKENLAAVRF